MAYINTSTFIEVYPTSTDFIDSFNDSAFASYIYPADGGDDMLTLIYWLLTSKYKNSHIADTDDDSFKNKINATIFQYEPTWAKTLEIQTALRKLTEAELRSGSIAKFTHGYNPSTVPGTANSDTEIETVNEQTLNKYTKSKLDGYAELVGMLEQDITQEFINKFSRLFMKTIDTEDLMLNLYEEEA